MISGPQNWKEDCSTGKRQSPIDIETAKTVMDKELGTFTLVNYNKTLNKTFRATNNGHALEMGFPGRAYNVSGGGLNGVYTTVQFHFHWGANNSVGSEHIVNGKEYAAEVSETIMETRPRKACHSVLIILGSFLLINPSVTTLLLAPDYSSIVENRCFDCLQFALHYIITCKKMQSSLPPLFLASVYMKET